MPRTSTRTRPNATDLLAEPTMLTLGRACEYLDVSRSVGYALAKEGIFPVRVERIRKSYRVPTTALMDYLGVRAEPPSDQAGSLSPAEPEPLPH